MEHNMPAKGGSATGGKYYFILGSNPTLSLAEIAAVLPINTAVFNDSVLVVDSDCEINGRQLIPRLGGTIKIGRIEAEIINYDTKKILQAVGNMIGRDLPAGKFKFGFSYYGNRKINIKVLGMELKKRLKEDSINSRWVISRDPVLSSVVVEQNKLIDSGMEICLIQDGNTLLIGRTEAVQPFKELSFRDYGRPARDDASGMLPPKLAQIMINLAGAKINDTLLDPFCGSGTILTEAMLMGYTNLIGSDISTKAVGDTKRNINWTIDKFAIDDSRSTINNLDARNLSEAIKPNTIDAIITEPFLGPQRGKVDYKKTVVELEKLYSASLAEFKKILKPNGKIVMIWPVFRGTGIEHKLNPILNGFKIINPIPQILQPNKTIRLTYRNTIIYGRPDQKVWREIVILTYI